MLVGVFKLVGMFKLVGVLKLVAVEVAVVAAMKAAVVFEAVVGFLEKKGEAGGLNPFPTVTQGSEGALILFTCVGMGSLND